MKKLIAGLLAMVMLFTGVAAADERLPYTYLPVKIVLSNLDEDVFRQWAYEKLTEFQDEYINLEPYTLFEEYYKLAGYKSWYGSLFGEEINDFGITIRSIEYTSETMTEEQLDQMYLLMILESLQEMKVTNQASWDKYLSMSVADRRVYTLQMDGTWQEDEYLESIVQQSTTDMVQTLTDVAASYIDLGVSTYMAYTSPNGNDIAESITKIATTMVKDLAKTIADNVKTAAENKIKRHLASMAAYTITKEKAVHMAYLREVYLSGNYPNERVVKIAQQLYDYYCSDACKNDLIAGGEAAVEDAIENDDLIGQFGMQLQAELEVSDILILTVMDAIKLALNEVVDNIKKNSTTKDPAAQVYEDTITGMLTQLIDKVCENIQDNWIKTGSFDFAKGFQFEEDDWTAFLQEINFFDMLSSKVSVEYMSGKMSGTSVVHRVREIDVSLPERLGVLLAYYAVLELPEAALDDLINRETASNYAKAAYKSLKNNACQFFKDACQIVTDYISDKIQLTPDEQKAKLKEVKKKNGGKMTTAKKEEVKKSYEKKVKNMEDSIKIVDVVASVVQKAWNIGDSSVQAYYATRDALSGEDEMSFLAEQTVTAKALSSPLRLNLLGMVPEHVLDKEKMTLAEVWSYVADMKKMADHDATGTNAYVNVKLKTFDHYQSDFVKILRGEGVFRYSILNLNAGTITYDYVNIYGGTGLVSIENARWLRDTTVMWANWTNMGFDESWLSMPQLWE